MPELPPDECRRRFAAADHAYLGTVSPDGRPHLVPVVVALDGDVVVHAVDHKPKRTTALRRLANVRAHAAVALLADRYDDDWDALWWVRADATAEVVEDGPVHAAAIALLVARHEQYGDRAPDGPVVRAVVERWSGWAASPSR